MIIMKVGTSRIPWDASKSILGNYPERVLADQTHRTHENRKYCKGYGIRLSGPKLGRFGMAKEDKVQEHQDNTDRIEVERSSSLGIACVQKWKQKPPSCCFISRNMASILKRQAYACMI